MKPEGMSDRAWIKLHETIARIEIRLEREAAARASKQPKAS